MLSYQVLLHELIGGGLMVRYFNRRHRLSDMMAEHEHKYYGGQNNDIE